MSIIERERSAHEVPNVIPNGEPERREPSLGRMLFAGIACLVVSAVIGGIAYGVGKQLPATYQSSGQIRIALASQGGISDPVVTAANDIATQYAQLASSVPVATLAAKSLGVPVRQIQGKITGGTVGAQNLVQVTASASSAADATNRARAASEALQAYVTRLNAQASVQYTARVQRSLGVIDQEITTLTDRIRTDSATQQSTDTALIESLNGQRDQLFGQVVRDAASNQPTLQVVTPASSASQTSPKPKLYALVALVVALIISGRVAYVLGRRARAW
jgi:capsular polysaccharide biosynthesis protein